MVSLVLEKFRGACYSFPIGVGLGWDKMHPRALARCSDQLLSALIIMLMLAEESGVWYDSVGVVMVVLIPKSDGGRRPIGLFPTPVRIWMRARLDIAQDWVKANERDFFYAGPRKGAEVAAWKQSLLAEAARMYTLPYISTLLDLVKAFNTIPSDLLAECAGRTGYNLWLLRLSLAAYALARVLDIEGCCSCLIFATRGLAAGSVLATIELRVLLIEIGDRVNSLSLYCRLTFYVDDTTIETICPANCVVETHAKIVNALVEGLQAMRMTLSDTKNVVSASTDKLARAVLGKFKNFAIKAARRVVSLGSGLGAGTRRNVTQVSKRLKGFRDRCSRFQKLKSVGVDTAKLVRTGGNASMVYGQRALGISNVTLHAQRRASLAVTCVRGCGANLDLALMLADDRSRGAADPAFEAHVGVLFEWSLAFWEAWAPPALFVSLINDAIKRLARVKSIWNVVYGPAAAVVATASRLGWVIHSASSWTTDDGQQLDLTIDSPAFVQDLAVRSVRRWRWRRIEHHFPALYSEGQGSGADWRAVQKALRLKSTEHWSFPQKGALKSAIAGRQWTQDRLFKAGLSTHNECLLCRHLPEGGVPGTLLHRYLCPALAPFRNLHMPKWLVDFLRTHGRNVNGAQHLALTRSLVRAPAIPARRESAYDSFIWHKQTFSVPSGCVVFTDGSLQDRKLPDGCQALGWAFAVVGPEGEYMSAAYGVPPKWLTTIQGAELWAVQMALQHVTFPESLYTDCDSVRLGTRMGREWANSPKRRLARVWNVIYGQLEDEHDLVHWMPAHTSAASIGSVCCSNGQEVDELKWDSNQLVDILAKEGADFIRLTPYERGSLIRREAHITELAVFVGKLTHAANSFVFPDGKVGRDSEAVRPKRKAKAKPKAKIVHPVSKGRKPEKKVTPAEWLDGWVRLCKQSGSRSSLRAQSKATSVKRAMAGISSRQEAMFFEYWRDNRECAMRSRACAQVQDAANTSASDRLDVIRRRMAGVSDDTRGSFFPPSSGAIRRDRSPQSSGRRRRSGSSSVQFCRSFVVSQYVIPNVTRSQNVSSSNLPQGPSVSRNGGPRVPSICSDGQQCDVGFCSRCGHCTSAQMRTDAKGPCIGGSTSSGSALSHASESVSVNGTIASSSSGAISGAVRQQLGVLPRVGVSSDGCCLGCGDRMSTPMHLANGPCKE